MDAARASAQGMVAECCLLSVSASRQLCGLQAKTVVPETLAAAMATASAPLPAPAARAAQGTRAQVTAAEEDADENGDGTFYAWEQAVSDLTGATVGPLGPAGLPGGVAAAGAISSLKLRPRGLRGASAALAAAQRGLLARRGGAHPLSLAAVAPGAPAPGLNAESECGLPGLVKTLAAETGAAAAAAEADPAGVQHEGALEPQTPPQRTPRHTHQRDCLFCIPSSKH